MATLEDFASLDENIYYLKFSNYANIKETEITMESSTFLLLTFTALHSFSYITIYIFSTPSIFSRQFALRKLP